MTTSTVAEMRQSADAIDELLTLPYCENTKRQIRDARNHLRFSADREDGLRNLVKYWRIIGREHEDCANVLEALLDK